MISPRDFDMGRVAIQCELVNKEVRAAAEVTVPNAYKSDIADEISSRGLQFISHPYDESHTEFIIYNYDHVPIIVDLIGNLENIQLKHWCWGKLFGYSEGEIGRYLHKCGFVK